MTATTLLHLLTEIPFVVIFAVVLRAALRSRTRSSIDVALYFGVLAALVVYGWFDRTLDLEPSPWTTVPVTIGLMALPYLLLRLVSDFTEVRLWILRGAEAGLAFSIVVLIAWPDGDLSLPLVFVLVAYFVTVAGYCAVRFVREAQSTSGTTRRRMQAAAVGTGLVASVIVWAGFSAAFPAEEHTWQMLSQVAAVAAAFAYLAAFAPPTMLKRAWQDPNLRDFLFRVPDLYLQPDLRSVVLSIQGAARRATDANAVISLWNDAAGRLEYYAREDGPNAPPRPMRGTFSQRAFRERRAIFVGNAPRMDPERAEDYRRARVVSMIVAPMIVGEQVLGTLVIYGGRAPLFAEDDMDLVRLMADQAAVVIENHRLAQQTANLRAQEEAVRLKEDFLSAAAHDLKTPLTTLVGQAQLMERRARRDPQAPPDLEGIERLARESGRMRSLINDLLDASRAEQGSLIGERHPVDLADIVEEHLRKIETPLHPRSVDLERPVPVVADPRRIEQVVQNLVENAAKYSPGGQEICVRVWQDGDSARISVRDHGIGIDPHEIDRVFERFWRSAGVDDRRYSGMGLGLYICRRIVEGHDGRIWAESATGQGSTFHVSIPLEANGAIA